MAYDTTITVDKNSVVQNSKEILQTEKSICRKFGTQILQISDKQQKS